jgi:cell division septation protein DedD
MEGSVRNLEQIQESDAESRMPMTAKVIIVSLGIACIGFAAVALSGKRTPSDTKKVDPLGELADKSGRGGAASPMKRAADLSPNDVTFPSMLSDDPHTTTALAAVKGNPAAPAQSSALVPVAPAATLVPVVPLAERAAEPAQASPGTMALSTPQSQAAAPDSPPPASDKLPVVPLPAQNVLEATPIVTRPRDNLTRAATTMAETATEKAQLAPSGKEGGYQLQVSSFRTQSEADQFATQLRQRNHKAYVVEAHVPGRGTWFRVRIGPFTTQHAAAAYRSGFEGREHVVPFIVPPSTGAGSHESHGDR